MQRVIQTLTIAAIAAAFAGCGGSSSSSSTTTTGSGSSTTAAAGVDKAAAALVPQAVKSKGEMVVASDASYAPMEFVGTDGKTIEGFDPDMAQAIAKVLGLKAKVVNASFDGILPGLASGKYDVGMSSFTDTKEREKTVNFVTYFSAGTHFFVKADGGPAINTLDDLCGHKVAVEKGTTQQNDALAQTKKCRAAGKPGVTVLVFPDQNSANLALSTGRADVGMADAPVVAYQVEKSGGKFKISGEQYGAAPFGIAMAKGNDMDKAILAAMKVLIADGQYKTILSKWGVSDQGITEPTINGATS